MRLITDVKTRQRLEEGRTNKGLEVQDTVLRPRRESEGTLNRMEICTTRVTLDGRTFTMQAVFSHRAPTREGDPSTCKTKKRTERLRVEGRRKAGDRTA